MRRLPLLLLLLFSSTAFAQVVKVMTYNIRLDLASDGNNRWDSRKGILVAQVLAQAPDFMGIQEALPGQVQHLADNLPAYKFIGVGRDDGKAAGEHSAIFYNSTKYKLLEQSTFWLSKTPDKPSKGWDAAYNRVCTYGLFQDIRSGNKLWVFNTHFDHVGNIARVESAKLILQKIQQLNTANLPVILTGDFNLEEDSESIALLSAALNDAKKAAKKTSGPQGTFNGFDTAMTEKRIDYIFVPKTGNVTSYTVLKEIKNGRYPSDHFPVIAEVILK